jgi:hypothetical protein
MPRALLQDLKWVDRLTRLHCVETGLRLIEEHDRHTLANSLGKVKGIPIGKPDAAVRLSFADLFRTGCPMDTITRLGYIDPDQADRIVGTGRNGKLLLSPHAFESEPWVVMIDGVLDDPANAVSAAWRRLLAAADRCWIESDQFVVAPERANDFGRLVDLNLEDPTIWPTIGNIGNGWLCRRDPMSCRD